MIKKLKSLKINKLLKIKKKKIADKKAYDLKMAVEAERIEQEKLRLAAEKAEKLKNQEEDQTKQPKKKSK